MIWSKFREEVKISLEHAENAVSILTDMEFVSGPEMDALMNVEVLLESVKKMSFDREKKENEP